MKYCYLLLAGMLIGQIFLWASNRNALAMAFTKTLPIDFTVAYVLNMLIIGLALVGLLGFATGEKFILSVCSMICSAILAHHFYAILNKIGCDCGLFFNNLTPQAHWLIYFSWFVFSTLVFLLELNPLTFILKTNIK